MPTEAFQDWLLPVAVSVERQLWLDAESKGEDLPGRLLEEEVAHRAELKAGTVWINNYRQSSFTTPFGGVKHSGIGREGGVEAVKEYLEAKSVWMSSDLPINSIFAGK